MWLFYLFLFGVIALYMFNKTRCERSASLPKARERERTELNKKVVQKIWPLILDMFGDPQTAVTTSNLPINTHGVLFPTQKKLL